MLLHNNVVMVSYLFLAADIVVMALSVAAAVLLGIVILQVDPKMMPTTTAMVTTNKTDKSKRKEVCFGGRVLTDEKLPPLFLGQFSFQPIIFFFCLFFLSVPAVLFGKCCGWRLGGQFGQFIAKSPLQGTLISPQITCCGLVRMQLLSSTMQQSTSKGRR